MTTDLAGFVRGVEALWVGQLSRFGSGNMYRAIDGSYYLWNNGTNLSFAT